MTETDPPARPGLHWRNTRRTEHLTVWIADPDYRLEGEGRRMGRSVRRDWVLYYRGREVSRPIRLAEGYRQAADHQRLLLAQPQRDRCTHGSGCPLHPTAWGIHDFTPSAADVLERLRTWAIDHEEYETQNQIGALAAELGVELPSLFTPGVNG